MNMQEIMSEHAVQEYEAEQNAYQEAQDWYSRTTQGGAAIPISSLSSRARKYALDMANAEQAYTTLQSDIAEGVPIERLRQTYPSVKFVVQDIPQEVTQGIQSQSLLLPDRTTQTQSKNKWGIFGQEMLPSVSAQEMPIDTRTGKPFGTLTAAPSFWQRAGQTFRPEKENILTTGISAPIRALRFISGELGRGEDILQQSAAKRGDTSAFYQSEARINLAQALPQAAYFTPAGSVLMVSGGAEKVIKEPTWTGKALGVGEAGIGLIGVRSGIKNFVVKNELNALEKTPLKVVGQRIENNGKGVDLLLGYKKVGNAQYLVKVQQPYFQVGETRTALEGGQGIAYRLKGNKLTAVKFESGGRVTSIESIPKITRGQVTQQFKDIQAGGGRIFTKQTGKAEYKLSGGMITPNQAVLNAQGTIQKVNEPSVWNTFTGVSKEGEGYFDIIGGQAKKARFYPKENRLSILSKPEVVGRIRVKKPLTTYDIFFTPEKGYTKLYHGTTKEQAKNILTGGFKKGVWGTQDISRAKGYAGRTFIKTGGKSEPIVLEFKVPKSEIEKSDLAEGFQISKKISAKQIIKLPPKQVAPTYASSLLKSGMKQVAPEVSEFSRIKPSKLFGSSQVTKTIKQDNINSNIFNMELQPSLVKQETKQRTISKIKAITKQRTNQNMFSSMSSILDLGQGEKSRERLLSKVLSIAKTETKQRSKSATSNLFRDMFRTPTRTKILLTPYIPKPQTAYSTKGGKVVKVDVGRYVVFVRRYGQDNIVGEAETLEEAKRILRLNLTSSLGASGFVTPKGNKERVNLDLGFGFRPAKREKGRVVQESWFRLGSQSERKEIQRAKKQSSINWLGGGKGKNKRFKWW